MNILIFYQYFGTPKGGWSTRIYEFTKRWVEEGHEVTVVTAPYYKSDIKGSGFISRQEIDGIKLVVINAPDSNKDSFFKRMSNALLFSVCSVYYALTLPADVVVSSSGPITIAIPGLFAKWFRSKKFVFEVRDLWPRGGIELGKINNPWMRKLGLWFEKLCYHHASLVVACSKGMEEGVKSINPNCSTLVIPNSSDVALFNVPNELPLAFPENWINCKVFIYAGSLGLMDDCSQILKGIATLQEPQFRFAFIGDGAEKAKLIQLAVSLKIEDKVFFGGLIPKNEVVKWFSVAQASFVTFMDLPVLHTSSPNKMFDSFAAGIPIIQSTKGWIFDLVLEEACGINVDPDDPEAFGSAISLMANEGNKRDEFAKNALRLAHKEFSRDLLAKKYIDSLVKVHHG